MYNELYERMTDDEKREYIHICEMKSERAEEYGYYAKSAIEAYGSLVREMQCMYDCKLRLVEAQRRYNEYGQIMRDKYETDIKSCCKGEAKTSLQPMEC